jgi:hypothetical protein
VLTGTYATTNAAMQGIASGMQGFYEKKYPDVAKTKATRDSQCAVTEVQEIFQAHYLPGDETELADPSQQLGTLLFQRVLPLPRRPARKRRRQGHQPGLQPVPHATVGDEGND